MFQQRVLTSVKMMKACQNILSKLDFEVNDFFELVNIFVNLNLSDALLGDLAMIIELNEEYLSKFITKNLIHTSLLIKVASALKNINENVRYIELYAIYKKIEMDTKLDVSLPIFATKMIQQLLEADAYDVFELRAFIKLVLYLTKLYYNIEEVELEISNLTRKLLPYCNFFKTFFNHFSYAHSPSKPHADIMINFKTHNFCINKLVQKIHKLQYKSDEIHINVSDETIKKILRSID